MNAKRKSSAHCIQEMVLSHLVRAHEFLTTPSDL